MATYTDNYNLIKPSYSEIADVAVINTNMNTIDNIMHSSQVSLAPAYDSTQTYNTGDVVMYELLMYKCTDDNVTGTWDASKWERTTASECGSSGSGGTDVEANPSGTATEELNKIRINQTIYSMPSGGNTDVYLYNGLIGSSGGSYVTVNLDKSLVPGIYTVIVNDNNTCYSTNFHYESGTINITIPIGTLQVTATTAGLTFYSGSFRNIYADILSIYIPN